MTGRLIVIEGIDGSGTETQSKLLLEYLKENNPQTEFISFPEYDKPVGRLISDFLFKKLEFDVEMQTLLHVADKVYAKPRIVKWLEEGKTVIADRYITSTMAYQGHMGFPVSGIMKMAEIFGIPKPNDIIFLKISADTSIRRKNKEKQELDRNEENIALLEQAAKKYDELAKHKIFCEWNVIDGEKPIKKIFEEVKNALKL